MKKQIDFINLYVRVYIYILYDICIIQINRDIEFSFIFHLNKYFRGGGGWWWISSFNPQFSAHFLPTKSQV